MFGHFPELIIILAIGLIVFGPEKLPEMAAGAGKMVREFREILDGAINPHDTQVPEDFSQYYYESLNRAGETPGDADDDLDLDSEGEYDLDADAEPEADDTMPAAEINDWHDGGETAQESTEEDLENSSGTTRPT